MANRTENLKQIINHVTEQRQQANDEVGRKVHGGVPGVEKDRQQVEKFESWLVTLYECLAQKE